MSDELDLDDLARVVSAAGGEWPDWPTFNRVFNPPTCARLVALALAATPHCKEFGCHQIRDGKNPSELQMERDQLKARVQDAERAMSKLAGQLGVKAAQVDRLRTAMERILMLAKDRTTSTGRVREEAAGIAAGVLAVTGDAETGES